jgi:hypothetical protein
MVGEEEKGMMYQSTAARENLQTMADRRAHHKR